MMGSTTSTTACGSEPDWIDCLHRHALHMRLEKTLALVSPPKSTIRLEKMPSPVIVTGLPAETDASAMMR